MFFLVRRTNIILEQDVGRSRTLWCIGILDSLFALPLSGETILANLKRDELTLTRRFGDCRVQKFGKTVNSRFIDGYFGDSLGKHLGKSTELTRGIVELNRELNRRTRQE
jgi:hypothetical protein